MKKTDSKFVEKRRLKKDYQPVLMRFGIKRKGSKTVPDQSLSIQDIISRFTRQIPVNVIQRDPVYLNQSEFDLERMSRMDFADKAAMAAEMSERAESVKAELQENERILGERKRKAKADRDSARAKKTGIDPLDNTMPVDTTKK